MLEEIYSLWFKDHFSEEPSIYNYIGDNGYEPLVLKGVYPQTFDGLPPRFFGRELESVGFELLDKNNLDKEVATFLFCNKKSIEFCIPDPVKEWLKKKDNWSLHPNAWYGPLIDRTGETYTPQSWARISGYNKKLDMMLLNINKKSPDFGKIVIYRYREEDSYFGKMFDNIQDAEKYFMKYFIGRCLH
ncbi:hypothetical protein D1R32_gp441 [Tunisvirus fontaine2]|uniref:Uncharacterized protein n=1 Tax=Tunisvirus fontaine2 TaxID=1421067 RepID=V9SE27_9VIRU|nr:hypothetical protein D1R32_gp441 [Tunisvirus fontaine2]AHC55158.1 hypothetical protein TNS_ORF440 [Tunisvirus fontaine2]